MGLDPDPMAAYARSLASGKAPCGRQACGPRGERLLLLTKADERPDELTIEATLTPDGDKKALACPALPAAPRASAGRA